MKNDSVNKYFWNYNKSKTTSQSYPIMIYYCCRISNAIDIVKSLTNFSGACLLKSMVPIDEDAIA